MGLVLAACLSWGCGPTLDTEGDWIGTFSSLAGGRGEAGTVYITVFDGTVSGKGWNTTSVRGFSIAGEVDSGGSVDVIYTYPGLATIRAKGQFERHGEHVTGDFELSVGKSRMGTGTLDLKKCPCPEGL